LFFVKPNEPGYAERTQLRQAIDAYEAEQSGEPEQHPKDTPLLHYLRKEKVPLKAIVDALGGHRSRLSDLVHGRRTLTLNQIRRFHYQLGVPWELLIPPPEPETEPETATQAPEPALP
jgi:HTH-type transcriptional regulator/antitoxin HigA